MSETIEQKSRRLRYRQGILHEINIEYITNWLWDVQEEIGEIDYISNDEDNILDAFDGNEEEVFEFKMSFLDLESDCSRLQDILEDEYVTEHFNDFVVGMAYKNNLPVSVLGFDTVQEDYFALTSYEEELSEMESGKRIKRLTKDKMIAVAGQCFGLILAYLSIRQKYDYLRATFDIIKGQNHAILQTVKDIEETYESIFYENGRVKDCCEEIWKFNSLVSMLPDEMWIE